MFEKYDGMFLICKFKGLGKRVAVADFKEQCWNCILRVEGDNGKPKLKQGVFG
jgi:hypothetical protein